LTRKAFVVNIVKILMQAKNRRFLVDTPKTMC